ncbi:12978_t:CDS:2, partial [Entrophospora sp. SA101]
EKIKYYPITIAQVVVDALKVFMPSPPVPTTSISESCNHYFFAGYKAAIIFGSLSLSYSLKLPEMLQFDPKDGSLFILDKL